MLKKTASILALSMVFALSAHAAGSMKPGLWELTTQSNGMKNMPKISPEQVEQMRKMGIDMAQLQSGALINKICISKAMAEREELPQMNHKESGCEMKNQNRSSAGYSADMICDSAAMKGKGGIKTVFASPESFSTSSEFKGTVQGTPVNDRTDTSGKWLGADCGSIKPIQDVVPKK